MIVLWFVISLFLNDLGDTLTGLAILHVPLVIYALRQDWHLFESGKRKVKVKQDELSPLSEPAPPPLAVPVPETDVDTHNLEPLTTPMTASDSEMATEVEVANPILNQREMDTEFDPQGAIIQESEQVEEDIRNLPTQLNPYPPLAESKDDETEAVKPKLTLDTSKLKSDARTETVKPKLHIDTSLMKSKDKQDDKPDSKSSRKGLTIDTSLMKSKDKQGDKPDSKSSRKGLKIDTSLMKSKDTQDDKPDSKSSRKGLKIDTSLMKSKDKQDDKPYSKSSRKGLTIDTSLVKKDTPKDDESDGDTPPPSTLTDTLPSRETTKLSTAEIKKQIADEAKRLKAEADAQDETEKKKPKFKLDTTRVKKDKDDETDE